MNAPQKALLLIQTFWIKAGVCVLHIGLDSKQNQLKRQNMLLITQIVSIILLQQFLFDTNAKIYLKEVHLCGSTQK
jgi:hypothetical protein